MLLLHILIALSSILYAGFAFFFPSKKKVNISYALIAATFTTGTILVIMKPSHMVSSCITGIIYLAVVSIGMISTNIKLAKEASKE